MPFCFVVLGCSHISGCSCSDDLLRKTRSSERDSIRKYNMDERLLRGKTNSEQVGYIWKFLDELAGNDPEKYNEFIKKTLEDGEKQGLGPPSHCFVIQTEKVPKIIPVRDFFINVCKWKQVPPPESDHDPIKIIASELREELISSNFCYVIDVAINPDVVEQCMQKTEEKNMLLELTLRYVEAVTNLKLETDCKMIENDYKGNKDNLLDMMCPDVLKKSVKDYRNPISEEKILKKLKNVDLNEKKMPSLDIEKSDTANSKPNEILLPSDVVSKNELFLHEASTSKNIEHKESDTSNEKKDSVTSKANNLKKPHYIERSEVCGQDVFKCIEIDLPDVTKIKDCELDIGDDFLTLQVPGKYHLFLELDKKIDEENTEAYFVRKNSKLVVKMKIV
ncbi:PIH1 domain-containing protein 2-like [Rhopilema esculentum]|uniref:PIH1 domain-containing protein 2-like n=1 Tax=Rhopilema esculentum TaxID=499914 RepID=UPI0031D4A4F0